MASNNGAISKQNPKSLTDGQMNIILTAHLKGHTSQEIADIFTKKTNKTMHPSAIRLVLAEQNKLWREKNSNSTEFYVQVELDRLRVMEMEAWRQYENAGGTVDRETTNELFNGDGEKIQRSVTTETKDDPNKALRWFKTILDVQASRRKLLKLEQAITFNATMITQKAYVGWSPDKAWPDAPELNSGAIEGEIVG